MKTSPANKMLTPGDYRMYQVKQRMTTSTGRVLKRGDIVVRGLHKDIDDKLEEMLNGKKDS